MQTSFALYDLKYLITDTCSVLICLFECSVEPHVATLLHGHLPPLAGQRASSQQHPHLWLSDQELKGIISFLQLLISPDVSCFQTNQQELNRMFTVRFDYTSWMFLSALRQGHQTDEAVADAHLTSASTGPKPSFTLTWGTQSWSQPPSGKPDISTPSLHFSSSSGNLVLTCSSCHFFCPSSC